jgi:hypothetical protein
VEIIAIAVVVVFHPNNLTTLCREPASIEPEGTKAQSNVITSEEIDLTVQQKNSEFGKSYLPKKANLKVKSKFQRSLVRSNVLASI